MDYRKLIEGLLGDDERVAVFGTTGRYYENYVIVPVGDIRRIDLAGCIEDTLHRMHDGGMTDEEIYAVLGAEKTDDWSDEDYYIDLDYVIKGQIIWVQ